MWPFKPKLPITPEDKEWVDVNLDWLNEQFGNHADPVTPTLDYFPKKLIENENDVREILNIVCQKMGLTGEGIELRFFDPAPVIDGVMPESEERDIPEGIYYQNDNGQHVIELNQQQLDNFINLVATIAHEVAHIKLLTLGDPEEDEEYLTDLTAIYFGFGIFIGNSAFNFKQWNDGYHQGWSTKRTGYLTEQVIAYAMTVLYKRDETSLWASFLNQSLKNYRSKTILFLRHIGEW